MAFTQLKETKDGRKYYRIRCQTSRKQEELSMRWYVPDGWSQKAIERELARQSSDFERRCEAGEVVSRRKKKEQEEAAAQAEAAIVTLQQYGDRVFLPAKAIECTENTRSSFSYILNNHVYPVIGKRKLTQITSADITALLLAKQKQKLAHATRVKIYSVLKLLFKMAYMTDLIERNPMDKVERPKPGKDAKQDEISAFTLEELRYILKCLEQEPLKWQVLIRLMMDTGIRRGECCALRWADIDFEECLITIRGNLCYTPSAGVYLDTPKNGKSRTIDIDPAVIEMLKALRKEQSSDCISPYIFSQTGSADPMHPQSPTRYMKRFEKKYGMKDFHPHKLRHSFASVAITNGADIASVSEKLGHSDKAVTLRMYTHADQESIKRASNIFRNALSETH